VTQADCVERIITHVKAVVEGLFAESRTWRDGHWLYEAEHATRQAMIEAGRRVLQELVNRRGRGHMGHWHTDPSGQRRKFKEYDRRTVQTLLGPVSVRRASYHSPSATPGTVHPLDAMLGLRHRFSEGIEEVTAFNAGQLTYGETAAVLEKALGLRLSQTAVQSIAGRWGAEVTATRADRTPQERGSSRMAVAVDAGKVRTAERRRKRKGSRKQHFTEHWADAKLGVVYRFDRRGKSQSDQRYVASLQSKDPFGQALWTQIAASGADRASHVVWLGDGADWVWSLKQEHLPHAVEVLDFYHARDHLHTVARALWTQNSSRRRRWVKTQQQRLLTGRVHHVVRELRRHARSLGPPPDGAADDDPRKVLANNVRYFKNNASRMRYDLYRRNGYPIGSGVVESGCKHVIAQRMKITASMSWSRDRAEAVLQLRGLVRSGQWDAFWALKRVAA
jgi:hypothetical protein